MGKYFRYYHSNYFVNMDADDDEWRVLIGVLQGYGVQLRRDGRPVVSEIAVIGLG